MNEWIGAALVGTGRASLPFHTLPPALAGLASSLADRPPEATLLLLAGSAELHATTGALPERAPSTDWRLPALRPEDDRPPCAPAAARLLERTLNGQGADLLSELLRLLDEAAVRAPDELLPHVLEHGAKTPRLRPLLWPILGERGRWLAAINPAWRYAAVDFGDWNSLRAAWEAEPAGRPPLALMVRQQNAARGRHLIEATWAAETDANRRELLRSLEPGLGPEDEAHLERALDDRDAQVRRQAAGLLAGLPGSRLVARVTSAAGDVLALENGQLTPHFPLITNAMLRDGVTRPLGNATSANDRSRFLIQTVGVIPPGHWEQRLRADPRTIARAALAGKWPRTLLTALATAALRSGDTRWATALVEEDNLSERVGSLLPLLPPEARRERLAAALESNDSNSVIVFLRRWPGEWEAPAAEGVIAFLGREAGHDPDTRSSPTLRYLMRQFAHRCPSALAGFAADTLEAQAANKAWEASIRLFVNTLAARRRMRAALQ